MAKEIEREASKKLRLRVKKERSREARRQKRGRRKGGGRCGGRRWRTCREGGEEDELRAP